MELNFATKSSMQMLLMFKVQTKSPFLISSQNQHPWFAAHVRSSGQRLAFSSTKVKGLNMKLTRCASFDDDFSDEEFPNLMQGLEFRPSDDEYIDDVENIDMTRVVPEVVDERDMCLSFPSKIEFPDSYWLGIRQEPQFWPERDEIRRISIEQKANSLDIPFSLRIIKRKQRLKEGFVDAGEYAYCSVKKAFSSLVFIIRELQDYSWQIKENLYREDLRIVLNKMQVDMNSMFVWLFQQVFSKTPTLMVYVMLLLANFSVHSMASSQELGYINLKALPATMTILEEESEEQSEINGRSTSLTCPNHGESGLWKSMVDEASKMEGELNYKVLDHRMRQQSVSPITAEIKPDNHEAIVKTNLIYQMCVDEEPNNPLLLINYARFLYLVAEDHDRAEECFKRAIQIEPPEAEALGQYADFLWHVRNDHWQAEERYIEALAVDPHNTHFASNYANFLWNTGAKDTCYPLSSPHDR